MSIVMGTAECRIWVSMTTTLGLEITESTEVAVAVPMDFAPSFTHSAYSMIDGLKDASGEFTGHFCTKDCDHGEDSPSPSRT